jgi:hypothetical protein
MEGNRLLAPPSYQTALEIGRYACIPFDAARDPPFCGSREARDSATTVRERLTAARMPRSAAGGAAERNWP